MCFDCVILFSSGTIKLFLLRNRLNFNGRNVPRGDGQIFSARGIPYSVRFFVRIFIFHRAGCKCLFCRRTVGSPNECIAVHFLFYSVRHVEIIISSVIGRSGPKRFPASHIADLVGIYMILLSCEIGRRVWLGNRATVYYTFNIKTIIGFRSIAAFTGSRRCTQRSSALARWYTISRETVSGETISEYISYRNLTRTQLVIIHVVYVNIV